MFFASNNFNSEKNFNFDLKFIKGLKKFYFQKPNLMMKSQILYLIVNRMKINSVI